MFLFFFLCLKVFNVRARALFVIVTVELSNKIHTPMCSGVCWRSSEWLHES